MPETSQDNKSKHPLKPGELLKQWPVILSVIMNIATFANWLLEFIKNPQVSRGAVLTSLLIAMFVLGWYIYQSYIASNNKGLIVIQFSILALITLVCGGIIGFVGGETVTENLLTLTPSPESVSSTEETPPPVPTLEETPAPEPTLPAADNTVYNFEHSSQDWKIGVTNLGTTLGETLGYSSEEAYAGSYSLKFEQEFDVENSTDIGLIRSPAQHRGNESVIAYLKVPMGTPSNLRAALFSFNEPGTFPGSNPTYNHDLSSAVPLSPEGWNRLTWVIPDDINSSDIGIGVKLYLASEEEIGVRDRNYRFSWEGAIYIDAIQIFRPVPIPTGTPTPTPPPTPTPTLTPTPNATPFTGMVVPEGVEALNVREQPGTCHEIVGHLNSGDKINILGLTYVGGWLEIEATGSDNLQGYVSTQFIEILEPIKEIIDIEPQHEPQDCLPTVLPPPPPTPIEEPMVIFVGGESVSGTLIPNQAREYRFLGTRGTNTFVLMFKSTADNVSFEIFPEQQRGNRVGSGSRPPRDLDNDSSTRELIWNGGSLQTTVFYRLRILSSEAIGYCLAPQPVDGWTCN